MPSSKFVTVYVVETMLEAAIVIESTNKGFAFLKSQVFCVFGIRVNLFSIGS
jgi:hypothetical protein